MALGADNLQPTWFVNQVLAQGFARGQFVAQRHAGFDDRALNANDFRCQLNVRAAPRHIGGDGHGAWLSGIGDNLRFFFVVARIEQLVFDALARQHAAEQLGCFHRSSAD